MSLRKRRAVLNHIGTVHAIAMANLCELACGMLMEVTIPTTMPRAASTPRTMTVPLSGLPWVTRPFWRGHLTL